MANINNYMNKVKIPKSLQNRVRRYLSYIWDSDHPVKITEITKNLSQTLKLEFTIQVNGTVLANCPILCSMFSKELRTELTQIFEEDTILPDEFIFYEDQLRQQNCNLYFIQEGTVKIVLKTGQVVASLHVSGGIDQLLEKRLLRRDLLLHQPRAVGFCAEPLLQRPVLHQPPEVHRAAGEVPAQPGKPCTVTL